MTLACRFARRAPMFFTVAATRAIRPGFAFFELADFEFVVFELVFRAVLAVPARAGFRADLVFEAMIDSSEKGT